jgi:hypothetical protein
MASASSSGPAPTGLIVLLYSYPDWSWDKYAQVKQANPNLRIIAVVNPDGGAGQSRDPHFASGIANLQAAGITVLGYVDTNYGSRDISSAESDIAHYMSWYGVNGIYIDRMANWVGEEWYYSTLTSYGKSIGLTVSVGNPGADVPPSYIGTVDTIVIYENVGAPSVSSLAGWHTSYSKSNFALIAYGVSSLDQQYVKSASSYVSYLLLTTGKWPDPYIDIVPDYLDGLVAMLAPGSTTSTIAAKPLSLAMVNGLPISALWVLWLMKWWPRATRS